MNKRNRLIFIAVATIIAIACACPMTSLPGSGDPTQVSNIPLPTIEIPTLPPIDVPTGNVLLQDDFSSDTGEWEIFSDGSEGSAEITNGSYVIQSFTNLWIWGRTDTDFTNTVTDLDVTYVSGPSNLNVGMGIFCWVNLRDDTSLDAYLLAISGDGYYNISQFNAGSPTSLVDWAYSDVINQGSATNSIRATCSGNQLTLEVNGVELASTTVSGGATSGGIALAAGSFESESPNAEVHFDNVVVSEP